MTKLPSTKHPIVRRSSMPFVWKLFPCARPRRRRQSFKLIFDYREGVYKGIIKVTKKKLQNQQPLCCERSFKHTNVTSNLQTLIRKLFREGKRTKKVGTLSHRYHCSRWFNYWLSPCIVCVFNLATGKKIRSESNPDVKWALMIFPWKLTLFAF